MLSSAIRASEEPRKPGRHGHLFPWANWQGEATPRQTGPSVFPDPVPLASRVLSCLDQRQQGLPSSRTPSSQPLKTKVFLDSPKHRPSATPNNNLGRDKHASGTGKQIFAFAGDQTQHVNRYLRIRWRCEEVRSPASLSRPAAWLSDGPPVAIGRAHCLITGLFLPTGSSGLITGVRRRRGLLVSRDPL